MTRSREDVGSPPEVQGLLASLSPEEQELAKAKAGVALDGDDPALRDPCYQISVWRMAAQSARCLGQTIRKTNVPIPEPWTARESRGRSEPLNVSDAAGLPDFPTHRLPSWLRDFVGAVAAETRTQQAVPAMITLSVVAATVARKVAVHIRDTWTEALNIYTVTTLGSSNLKTPAFKLALDPLERWERVHAAAMRDKIVEAENNQANLKAQLEETRRKAAKANAEGKRRDFLGETERLARQLAEQVVPRPLQLVATDVTEESLGKLLVENHGRVALMSDEGGPFRNMAGRYQKNAVPFFDLFKHGHNAGTVRVNRLGRGPIHVQNAAITMALMVQPPLLRALKQTPEFRAEGLLARFLYAVPDDLVGARDWMGDVRIPLQVVEAYRERINSLLDLPFGLNEDGAPAPHVMELSGEARERVVRLRQDLEPRLGRGGDLSHVSDWGGKATGAAVRIGSLIHLAELAGRPEPWREPVTVEAMDAALAITRDFLIPHALAAFSLIGGDATTDLAEEILAWIRRHGHARFTKRDLHRHLRSHVENPKEWNDPLALLEAKGWIRAVEPDQKRKGRPSEEFDINPKALEGTSPNPERPADHGDAWEGPDHD